MKSELSADERMEEIVYRYTCKSKALNEEYSITGGAHFPHISGNLLQRMVSTSDPKVFFSNLKRLRKYWQLIREFPDFREKEIKSNEHLSAEPTLYFPEWPGKLSKEIHYVDYAAQKLEDN